MDDLTVCRLHLIPINRCAECWPLFLRELGGRCWNYLVKRGNIWRNDIAVVGLP